MIIKDKPDDTLPTFVMKTAAEAFFFGLLVFAFHIVGRMVGIGRQWDWSDYLPMLCGALIGITAVRYYQWVTSRDPNSGKPIRTRLTEKAPDSF